jgi:Phospholipase_D-nuclease N-terminal
MLLFDGGFGLILLGLWLFCIIDVITTDESRIRNLPKLAWLFIVLLLPDIGSIAWLVGGHTWNGSAPTSRSKAAASYPEYARPGRHIPLNPDDDEAFLRQVRERAQRQRDQAERDRKAREQDPSTD